MHDIFQFTRILGSLVFLIFLFVAAGFGQIILLDTKPLPRTTPKPTAIATPAPSPAATPAPAPTPIETPTPTAPVTIASPEPSPLTTSNPGPEPSVTPTPTESSVEYSESGSQAESSMEKGRFSEKPIAFADFKTRAKAMKAKDHLLFSYDRFKDKTIIATKPQNIVSTGASIAVAIADSLATGPYGSGRTTGLPTSLTFSIGYIFKGNSLSETPERFALLFQSNARSWVFLKGDRNLYFIIGNERFELHPLAEDRDINLGYSVTVGELLGFEISREMLQRISDGGKSVEIRLGDTLPRHFQSGWTKRVRALLDFTKLEPEKP